MEVSSPHAASSSSSEAAGGNTTVEGEEMTEPLTAGESLNINVNPTADNHLQGTDGDERGGPLDDASLWGGRGTLNVDGSQGDFGVGKFAEFISSTTEGIA